MADLKVVNIDLTGGVVTDAEAPDIGTQIADSENLVKPVGGSPRGLRVRPGVSYFDRIASANPATEGVAPFVCTLDPEDGFPGGSYVTALVDRTTGEILEMSWGIETRGEPAPDETYEPEPDWVPLMETDASASFDGVWSSCLVAWSPLRGKLRYFYITDPGQIDNGNSGTVTASGRYVRNNLRASSDSVGCYDFAGMVAGNRAAMAGVTPPPNIDELVRTDQEWGRVLGPLVYSGTGGEWVDSNGIHYALRQNNAGVVTAVLARTNVETGEALEDVTITLPTGGGTLGSAAFNFWGRPDASGHVVACYSTHSDSRHWLAKVNPVTGAVVNSLEITSLQSDMSLFNVIPLSTGGYFLWTENGSGLESKWFWLASDLTGATEILSGRITGQRSRPLLNCGGVDDTVFLYDMDTMNLQKVAAVSTSPVLSDLGELPSSGDGFSVNALDYSRNHFRIDDNTMMWGMGKIVSLATGEVTETLALEDEYGLEQYDPLVPGGSLFFYGSLACDPLRYLQSREGTAS